MVKHLSGVEINQAQAEFFGAAAQTVNHACAMEFQIGSGAGIAVSEFAAQNTIDEYGKFAGGGGNRLRWTQPRGQAAIIGAQSSGAAGETHGSSAQHRRRTIGRGFGSWN